MAPDLPALVTRARAGDPTARDALARHLLPRVLPWVARLGGLGVDREEAAHDVLLTVLRRLDTLEGVDRIEPWTFGITRGVVAWHRRRAWVRRWTGRTPPDTPDPRPRRRDRSRRAPRRRAAPTRPRPLDRLGRRRARRRRAPRPRAPPLPFPRCGARGRCRPLPPPRPHAPARRRGPPRRHGRRTHDHLEIWKGRLSVLHRRSPSLGDARSARRTAGRPCLRDAGRARHHRDNERGDVQLACAAADRAADTAAPPNATPADPNELRPPAFPAPAHLPAGETRTCPPTTAAGLLGRARALQRAGADPLPAVDAGLAAGPDAAVRDELVSLLLDIQLQQGDLPGALRTAEAHLKTGGAQRRDALLTLAARLAARLHGCEAATPWLAELGPASGALAAELGCTRIE